VFVKSLIAGAMSVYIIYWWYSHFTLWTCSVLSRNFCPFCCKSNNTISLKESLKNSEQICFICRHWTIKIKHMHCLVVYIYTPFTSITSTPVPLQWIVLIMDYWFVYIWIESSVSKNTALIASYFHKTNGVKTIKLILSLFNRRAISEISQRQPFPQTVLSVKCISTK